MERVQVMIQTVTGRGHGLVIGNFLSQVGLVSGMAHLQLTVIDRVSMMHRNGHVAT